MNIAPAADPASETNSLPAIDWDVPHTQYWIVYRQILPARWTRAKQKEVEQHTLMFARALELLNRAVQLGLVAAWGRPSNTWERPRVPSMRRQIPAAFIDELRQIDGDGRCSIRADAPNFEWLHEEELQGGPSFYYDVVFRVADVERFPWDEQISAVLPIAIKPPKTRGGGRSPKYSWEPVLKEVRQHLEDDGAPARGDGGQAKLEKFVLGKFPVDACPSEGIVRKKVRSEIEKHQRKVGH